MPKRISKEEFDSRFGKRRFSEQELFERGLSTDPNGQVRPTAEVFNDLFIDGVNRLGLSHPEAKARANSYFGRNTDPLSHTQAGPELQSLVTKAQTSPPPPADILNAPKPTSATGDPWLDGPSSNPQDYFNIRRSVERTDPWGGGSVPPDQVPHSSRQPYIHPEDLQLAVRMLNEAKETQSPTGNRMGMKFPPELLAALLVPSAVVSPLVLDEIGKPKELYEKALQETY